MSEEEAAPRVVGSETLPELKETKDLRALDEAQKPIAKGSIVLPDLPPQKEGAARRPRGRKVMVNNDSIIYWPSAPLGGSAVDERYRDAFAELSAYQAQAEKAVAGDKDAPAEGSAIEHKKFTLLFRSLVMAGLAYNYTDDTIAELLDEGDIDVRNQVDLLLSYQGYDVQEHLRFQPENESNPT